MIYVGIDVGGTGIQVGLVDESGKILCKGGIVTRTDIPFDMQVKAMADCVLDTIDKGGYTLGDVKAIGAGVPGVTDPRTGNIAFCTNLGWVDVPFVQEFNKHIAKPVFVGNDATVAGLAESVAGVSAGSDSSVFITLGTGVGGGIVFNGKVWNGFHGVGSEIGHMILELDGEPCTCGNYGCVERYCSATAIIRMAREGDVDRIDEILRSVVAITHRGKQIRCKTLGQQEYVQAIRDHDLTFAVGPAGTGKTYLAVAAAVAAFRDKQVNRIILTRPAVEAGERLGFLPGDLQSKVDPYLRPLYDALFDMLGAETYQKYLERGNIEVAPLAYMRGRTLDDSFIILDEAQNTSREQMKMFLTRMGFGSKVVITGDVTQIDLPADKVSGLKEAMKVLRDVEGVAICKLTKEDVVRHVMVQRIIEAYAKFEEKKK